MGHRRVHRLTFLRRFGIDLQHLALTGGVVPPLRRNARCIWGTPPDPDPQSPREAPTYRSLLGTIPHTRIRCRLDLARSHRRILLRLRDPLHEVLIGVRRHLSRTLFRIIPEVRDAGKSLGPECPSALFGIPVPHGTEERSPHRGRPVLRDQIVGYRWTVA
jgi:hypothetical protein